MYEYLLTTVKFRAFDIATNNTRNIYMLVLALVGFKTIITPINPIIIEIQLITLSFSFKINFAKIIRKKGVVINNVVKIFRGIYFSE